LAEAAAEHESERREKRREKHVNAVFVLENRLVKWDMLNL